MNEETAVIAKGWLTTSEAVDVSGYVAEYLRRLAREGRVRAEKLGRQWLFNKDSLLAWKRQMEELGTKKHSPKGVGDAA